LKKPSLYPTERVCFICKTPLNVEQHHIFKASRRPISDREGATIFLCHEHHQGRTGVHNDSRFDAWLKRDCQRRWEAREGVDDPDHSGFIQLFGCSYL
jgi:hypothetical protein